MVDASRAALMECLGEGGYVLFLGAGASLEIGLKNWYDSLLQLSEFAMGYNELYARLIKEEANQYDYLLAAEHFFNIKNIPDSSKCALLQQVFSCSDYTFSNRYEKLVKSNFAGIVTTNYDDGFLKAATKLGVELTSFGESEDDLVAVRTHSGRFHVRIHGRIEVPSRMILSKSQYQKLKESKVYCGLIYHLLETYNIIFFGFSFQDPFFQKILEVIAGMSGGRFRKNAFALFPKRPESDILRILNSVSIASIEYSAEENHAEIWEILGNYPARTDSKGESRRKQEDSVLRYFQYALTHFRLRNDVSTRHAMLEILSIQILNQLLKSANSLSVETATNTILSDLCLPERDAISIREVFSSLSKDGRLHLEGNYILGIVDDTKESDLDGLVQGVLSRATIRGGITLSPSFDYSPSLREIITRVIIGDGLKICERLTRTYLPADSDLKADVDRAIASQSRANRDRLYPLRESIVQLFSRPDAGEESLLDKLGNIVITTCMVVVDPMLINFADELNSRMIFLDASVVLPWLATGHPVRDMYDKIVKDLSNSRPCIAESYLNEIVSHRRLAVREYEEATGGVFSRFREYSQFYGLQNINAFLGGYGGTCTESNHIDFQRYLEKVAPFTDEVGAGQYLKSKGFRIVTTADMRKDNIRAFDEAKAMLEMGTNSTRKSRGFSQIEHDALMLAYLFKHAKEQYSPVLITADQTILRLAVESQFREIKKQMLLPWDAVHLAEVSGRGNRQLRGLCRSIWNVGITDADRIREYYVDRVLQEYEPILAYKIERIVEELCSEIERTSNNLSPNAMKDPALLPITSKFRALDRFEPSFHTKMKTAMNDRMEMEMRLRTQTKSNSRRPPRKG